MNNLEALEKRQQDILKSMSYLEDGKNATEYAEYTKDLLKVNDAIKVEKDYEIQQRKLDIEEEKAKNEEAKIKADIKVAEMEAKSAQRTNIWNFSKALLATATTVFGYILISDSERFGAVTSKVKDFIQKPRID